MLHSLKRSLQHTAVSLYLAAAPLGAFANSPAEVPIGGTLPEATLRGLNGPARSLSVFRGRPLIINVWASWCGPCKAEMASFERLAWRTEARYFAIIGISTDDDAEQAKRLLDNTNATLSQFIDTGLQMESMLGASRLPLTVFIDADGRILGKIYGARQWDDAEALHLIDDTFHKRVQRP
jgi:thiol-disulfide isomerase/thioredoxin